jgi:hypothetical protein
VNRGLPPRVLLPGALFSAVALALVALLTGGNRGGASLREPALRPSATPTTSPLESVVPELQRFVEEARGLGFRRPVVVQVLEDAAFHRRIRTLIRPSLVEGSRRLRVLKALGLVPADVQLSRTRPDTSSYLGLYDVRTHRLLVRGKEATPFLRSVMVHELTHALQDQHFDLGRRRTRSGQTAQGFTAVVEGDATRIERLYRRSLPPDQQVLADEEEANLQSGGGSGGLPPAVSRFIAFPYQVGAEFTTSLVGLSGQRALDDAFAQPPRTAEQLLHPVDFVAGEGALDVPRPEADRRAVVTETLGEFGLQVLLDGVVSDEEIERATSGWGGDRYVVWADGSRNCVRLHAMMDTAADAEELAAALGTWAARSGATVEGRQPIVVEACN